MDYNGYPMTGRTPGWVNHLNSQHGPGIWDGAAGSADRGDRHSQRAERARAAANRKETPMTDSKTAAPNTSKTVKELVGLLRSVFSGNISIDPVDKDAPVGTQVRRIAAYNALHDLAKPGRDRYCGDPVNNGRPCVLRAGHPPAMFDPTTACMDSEQRERALRYLVHSEPDKAKRA